jgi:ankyrin repeat protein
MIRALLLAALSISLAGCGVTIFSAGSHDDKRTPLEKAATAGNLNEVRRLLASGADPNDRDAIYGSPLNAAASRNGNAEVIRALVAAGANPNGRAEECWLAPLIRAASMGDLENTRALLDAGAAVSQSRCSRLALGWLKPSVIDLLRPHGLDIFAADELGRNELHLALAPPVVPNPESIEYLVNAGLPLNARDHLGRTPLSYWREPRHMEIHWFQTWIAERLLDDAGYRGQQENRVKISALLERSGAGL